MNEKEYKVDPHIMEIISFGSKHVLRKSGEILDKSKKRLAETESLKVDLNIIETDLTPVDP